MTTAMTTIAQMDKQQDKQIEFEEYYTKVSEAMDQVPTLVERINSCELAKTWLFEQPEYTDLLLGCPKQIAMRKGFNSVGSGWGAITESTVEFEPEFKVLASKIINTELPLPVKFEGYLLLTDTRHIKA